MKHLIPLFTFTLFLRLFSPAAEVVVYSPPSDQPLHVQSTNPVSSTPPSASVFPSAYTGHRAVCRLPGASTNDTFAAWAGGDTFTPGDPFGVSTGRDYPAIELTRTSPITPRINIFEETSDRPRTKDEIYRELVEEIYAKLLPPIAQSNALAQLSWTNSNAIAKPILKPNEDVRVRVVRWLVDGHPDWEIGVSPRVVLDKTFRAGKKDMITEADILSDAAFDIDWQYLQSEVVNAWGVQSMELDVTEVDYLVVIGEGVTSFSGKNDSNNVVRAIGPIISRHFGTNHVQAVALPANTQPLTHPVFRFEVDCPELEGYTACQIQVMSGVTTNWTSGTIRIPPRDSTGTYVYSAPDLTGLVSTNQHTWRVTVYNSKFREDNWSDPEPVAFSSSSPSPTPIPTPSTSPVAELVVYSPASDHPLHISGGGVTRTFPASYTGHRAVCRLPCASTNGTFVAWIGGDTFTPGDPYGVSTARDFPTIELNEKSPITPRIDVMHKTAYPVRTIQEIYTEVEEKIYEKYPPTQPIAISNELANLNWRDTNHIEEPTIDTTKDVRVRVVRWLVDGNPIWLCGVEPRVVLDKKFHAGTQGDLTEADILSDEAFDLDWQYFHSEVYNAYGVQGMQLPVAEVDYLVVIGDGVTDFKGRSDTQNVVKALSPVISRRYGTNHVQAVALPSNTQPLTHPVFRFRADCPELEGYTACQLQVMSGATTNWTSGTIRIPPRDRTGAYVYSAPDLTGLVSTNVTYAWRAIVYNAKFQGESIPDWQHYGSRIPLKWSDPIPVTFE